MSKTSTLIALLSAGLIIAPAATHLYGADESAAKPTEQKASDTEKASSAQQAQQPSSPSGQQSDDDSDSCSY